MATASTATPGTITVLLRKARDGDLHARDRLFVLVDQDLRRLAAGMLPKGGWVHGELDATALVNSACERLLGKEQLDAECRKHFFFILGRAMHDCLVEQARAAGSAKRGGGHHRVPLVEFHTDGHRTAAGMLDLDEALEALRTHDPDGAQIVQLRFFGGRTLEEAAEIMGCTFAAARQHWDYARAWLHERLAARDGPPVATS